MPDDGVLKVNAFKSRGRVREPVQVDHAGRSRWETGCQVQARLSFGTTGLHVHRLLRMQRILSRILHVREGCDVRERMNQIPQLARKGRSAKRLRIWMRCLTVSTLIAPVPPSGPLPGTALAWHPHRADARCMRHGRVDGHVPRRTVWPSFARRDVCRAA